MLDSCSLAELFSSSWAIRIMVRPATTSGMIAIAIAKNISFLRSESRNIPTAYRAYAAAPRPASLASADVDLDLVQRLAAR